MDVVPSFCFFLPEPGLKNLEGWKKMGCLVLDDSIRVNKG